MMDRFRGISMGRALRPTFVILGGVRLRTDPARGQAQRLKHSHDTVHLHRITRIAGFVSRHHVASPRPRAEHDRSRIPSKEEILASELQPSVPPPIPIFAVTEKSSVWMK